MLRFERLYAQSEDPWEYRTSSYEREKYRATLAALGPGRRDRCLEVGCSIGVFTELLAALCGSVVGIDFSPTAIERARRNLDGVANVEVQLAAFPEEVPCGPWDLIICSEILYYLPQAQLQLAIGWLGAELESGATVVVVSWRGEGGDEPHRGDDVHDRLAQLFAARHTLDARRDGYRLDRFRGGV